MNEVVKIRGLKTGLQLLFEKNAKFEDVKAILYEKLVSGDKFFIRGTTVYIPSQTLPTDQMEVLRKTFHQHGMLFRTELPKVAQKVEPILVPAEDDFIRTNLETLQNSVLQIRKKSTSQQEKKNELNMNSGKEPPTGEKAVKKAKNRGGG